MDRDEAKRQLAYAIEDELGCNFDFADECLAAAFTALDALFSPELAEARAALEEPTPYVCGVCGTELSRMRAGPGSGSLFNDHNCRAPKPEDPYAGCAVYEAHGACQCSTSVMCAACMFRAAPDEGEEG